MAKEFTLFLCLPTELRLRIWEAAEPLFPRTLICTPLRGSQNSLERKWIVTPSSDPTLLYVSKESRELLLPRYTSSLFSLANVVSPVLDLLVNCEVDTVYIKMMNTEVDDPSDMVFKQLFRQHGNERPARIRSLAGNEFFWLSISEGGGWNSYKDSKQFEIFRGWTELREIKLVLAEDELDDMMTQSRRSGQGHHKLSVKGRRQNDGHEWFLGVMKKGFDGLNEGNKEVKIGREVACIERY